MRFETAALLAELDVLAYPERMRLLALRAREHAGSGVLGPLLDDLYRGDRFQREIAVFMAVVAAYHPLIEIARQDPVWEIRRPAVSAWLRSGAPPADRSRPS